MSIRVWFALVVIALIVYSSSSHCENIHIDSDGSQSSQPIDQWMRNRIEERFSTYVQIDTQSDFMSPSVPSTLKQLNLSEVLLSELKQWNNYLKDIDMDQYGNVYARLPANTKKEGVKSIGFLAHLDTATELPGEGVIPVVHRKYQKGNSLIVNDQVIVDYKVDGKLLDGLVGHDIFTASGNTLLGADDKSGIAEIMTAVEFLIHNPHIPHGEVNIAFTIDEEIGRGPKYFNISKFGSEIAFTVDGGDVGTYNVESFSADMLVITINGYNIHPGTAFGRMKNSIKLASQFINSLPELESPENTKDKQGFIHCLDITGNVDKTTMHCLLRSFDNSELIRYKTLVEELLRNITSDFSVQVIEQYRNMKQVIDEHPFMEKSIVETYKLVGIENIQSVPIRGGTDGSQLSWMGLPTANIFAGGKNCHSTSEFVSIHEMSLATRVIIQLIQYYESNCK